MRPSLSFLSLAFLVILSSAPTYGDKEIVLDHVTGLYGGDTVCVDSAICWHFRLTNTDGDTITGSNNGFRVWMVGGGLRTPATLDTHALGWPTMYDLVTSINYFSADGTGADTVGFGGARLMSTGIPNGFDEEVWWICTTPDASANSDTLCIDSTFYPPGGEWLWSMALAGDITPHWDGPHCFHVYDYQPPPCTCTVEFTVCVPCTVTYHDCGDTVTVQRTFCAKDSCLPPGQPIIFSGPGNFDQISDTCAEWSWTFTTSLDYLDDSGWLLIEACGACTCTACSAVYLIEIDDTASFYGGCDDTVGVSPENTVQYQMAVDSACSPYVTFIYSVSPDPIGNYSIDSNDFVTFYTDPSDSGLFCFNVCVIGGGGTFCCCLYFNVTNACCQDRGNVNGDSGVNVADLTHLVGYLFFGGLPPACNEEGDVDDSGAINVADLTYLVEYLFFTGPPPPPCP